MHLFRALLPIAISISVVPVLAQAPLQRDPQAVALLTQSLAVSAGSAGRVQDTVADGTIAWPDGTTGTIRLKTKGLDGLRSEVSTGGVQTISVARGGRGHSDREGTRRNMPRWATAYLRPIHLPAFSRLGDYAKAQMNVIYVGLEDVNGQPAHHIRLFALPTDDTPPEIEEIISDFHLFLDARSLLVVKTLSYDFSPDAIENRTLVETYFEDYRSDGGLAIPHHIARYVAGQKQMEIDLSTIRLNVGLPDSEFQ